MDRYLEGKKILFIGIGFYDYDKAIKEEMENAGASVDYFIEFPITFKSKIYSRISLRMLKELKKKRQIEILKKTKDDYDYIFVIKGETLKKYFIEKLREKNKKAEFIMYQWDSIERVENYNEIINLFDKKYSFDRIDCINNKNLIFLPLFYRKSNFAESKNKEIDLLFVGWFHSDRYQIIAEISKVCNTEKINTYFHIYMGRFFFYINKIFNKEFRDINKEFIKFKPLSYQKYLELIENSNVILDISHPKQTGLTMRTIELIASCKKILTTNKEIIHYDFYNSNNIQIFDRNKIEINMEIFKKEYSHIEETIIENYSLRNWIYQIFKK